MTETHEPGWWKLREAKRLLLDPLPGSDRPLFTDRDAEVWVEAAQTMARWFVAQQVRPVKGQQDVNQLTADAVLKVAQELREEFCSQNASKDYNALLEAARDALKASPRYPRVHKTTLSGDGQVTLTLTPTQEFKAQVGAELRPRLAAVRAAFAWWRSLPWWTRLGLTLAGRGLRYQEARWPSVAVSGKAEDARAASAHAEIKAWWRGLPAWRRAWLVACGRPLGWHLARWAQRRRSDHPV